MEDMIFVSARGKQIVFDDYEKFDEDEYEDAAYWTYMCPSCHKKYRGILGKRCANDGSGDASCGVKGCENTNANWYVDFAKADVKFA